MTDCSHTVPRSTSFRSACPGPYSAAGCAGSLISSNLKLIWLSAICAILVFFPGCNRPQPNESRPAEKPPVAPQVRSSADVVKAQAAVVSIDPGSKADAIVAFKISAGFHVNANPATFPYLIATEVTHTSNPDECVNVGKPVYPTAIYKKFAFAEKPLAVYEGDVNVRLPLSLPGKCYVTYKSGAQLSLPITIKVQACDEQECYPPATLTSTISVNVK